MKQKLREKPPERVWEDFKEQESLTDVQLDQFKKYEALLSEWNKTMNLTAISGLSSVVLRHFVDSLALCKFFDVSSFGLVVDVGSGGGFPGLPLKIMFPDLPMILIEVSKKKQRFLHAVIAALELEEIEVCGLDWRTFLRTTKSDVKYVLARASLGPLELCRMLKPGCTYKNANIIYWASEDWQPDPLIEKFFKRELFYKLKRKTRKLVLMGLPE